MSSRYGNVKECQYPCLCQSPCLYDIKTHSFRVVVFFLMNTAFQGVAINRGWHLSEGDIFSKWLAEDGCSIEGIR